MRTLRTFQALVLMSLIAPVVAAQQQPAVPMTALPPPAIDDPGVSETLDRESPAVPSLRADPVTQPTESPPEVNIREQDGDVIQEYSRNGVIYMIRVVPENGVVQTFIDTDGDGLLNSNDTIQGAVKPVYYTLYEWD